MDENEWKKKLTPEQYRILREKGTEKPFTGEYHDTKEKGIYKCAGCGEELFSSDTKFDSGSGWPSFSESVSKENIIKQSDTSLGMERTEVLCKKCGGHLGHVFNDLPRSKAGLPRQSDSKADGPQPEGKRFCINSGALQLDKSDKTK